MRSGCVRSRLRLPVQSPVAPRVHLDQCAVVAVHPVVEHQRPGLVADPADLAGLRVVAVLAVRGGGALGQQALGSLAQGRGEFGREGGHRPQRHGSDRCTT